MFRTVYTDKRCVHPSDVDLGVDTRYNLKPLFEPYANKRHLHFGPFQNWNSLFQALSLWRAKENSGAREKKPGEAGEGGERTPVKVIIKSSWRYTRIWYILWLAKFDTCCQHYSVADADKKCDMACEGHPPSSHARLESVLQQALKDFSQVDSFRKQQKDCIKKMFLGGDCSPFFAISAKTKLSAPEKPTKCDLSRLLNGWKTGGRAVENGYHARVNGWRKNFNE